MMLQRHHAVIAAIAFLGCGGASPKPGAPAEASGSVASDSKAAAHRASVSALYEGCTPPRAPAEPWPTEDRDPPTTGPAGKLRFEVAERTLQVGSEKFARLVADDEGGGIGSRAGHALVILRRPDGTRVWHGVAIGSSEATAFCLPVQGQGGCEHDRRVIPFTGIDLQFIGWKGTVRDHTIVATPGSYQLSLHDSSGGFEAPTLSFEVKRNEMAERMPHLCIGRFTLAYKKIAHGGDEGAFEGTYEDVTAEDGAQVVVSAYRMYEPARTFEMMDTFARLAKGTPFSALPGVESVRISGSFPRQQHRWASGHYIINVTTRVLDDAEVRPFLDNYLATYPAAQP